MHKKLILIIFSVILFPDFSSSQIKESALEWPEITRQETRPWTWWWWHGCAVSKPDITIHLEELHQKGIGGVNIICLLDVDVDKEQKLIFRSPEWIDVITYAIREARRLGMDVDISPVCGWAFGGPEVPLAESSSHVEVLRWNRKEITTQMLISLPEDIIAVIFIGLEGNQTDITSGLLSGELKEESLDEGTYYVMRIKYGSARVRMPTPGFDGWVVDHLSAEAVRNYFSNFDKAFDGLNPDELPRAFLNDSWEINMNWGTDFLKEFRKRRGYQLTGYLPAFMGYGNRDTISRIACDYRYTLSDLLIDEFTKTFYDWAAGYEKIITGEAQDEPGNELDLNVLYHIPQADMGGPRSWFIQNGDYVTDHFFRRCKIPASTAHLLGKPFISSETFTCMGPILDTPFDLMKEKLDYDFIAGVNHTMYHGITYSPVDAEWPGWLFYAGTHLGSFNPMWNQQGKQLSDYVARCQSFLQEGTPDADILVYYPMFDLWSQRGYDENTLPGLISMNSGPVAADTIWRAGYDFDFVSDRLLDSIVIENDLFKAPGTTYRSLIISSCKLMPAETLEKVISFIYHGGTVLFHGEIPEDVPGLNSLKERRSRFYEAISIIEKLRQDSKDEMVIKYGKGQVIFGDNIIQCLDKSKILREQMTDLGLHYIRRKDTDGTVYFIVNPSENNKVDTWIPLASEGKSAAIFDPMTGKKGMAAFKDGKQGSTVLLQLEPNESRIIKIYNNKMAYDNEKWRYYTSFGQPVRLKGEWTVSFIDGGASIPHIEVIDSLQSWTEWNSDQKEFLKTFSGIARYSIRFQCPPVEADEWLLDLGEVHHTASVKLNGKSLGNLFSKPMKVLADNLNINGTNLLEIEVANAPVNRAAYLDMQGIQWQKTMGEDANTFIWGDSLFPWDKKDDTWIPKSSGLVGPVQLMPVRNVK